MLYAFPTLYNCYPYHWKITGSNDGIHFITVDNKKESREEACVPSKIRSYPLYLKHAFYFFRFHQTAKSCYGKDNINMAEFELFGSFDNQITCVQKNPLRFDSIFILINILIIKI